MKTNQAYTTKDINAAILATFKTFYPACREMKKNPACVYRDANKTHVRYKVDEMLKPEQRIIDHLQNLLPAAKVEKFTWKRWHPMMGGWEDQVVVIRVPYKEEDPEEKAIKAYEKLKEEVWKQIKKHKIEWDTEVSVWDLILVIGDFSCISIDAEDFTLFWNNGDGVDWTDLYEAKDASLIEKVLDDIRKYGVVDYDFD